MASQQPAYHDDGPDPEGGQEGAYDDQQQQQQGNAPAGKKKRAYAGQAYEFGAGGNAALGGQQVAGGPQYPGSQSAPAAGYGYPGPQQAEQAPQYGLPPAQAPAYNGQPAAAAYAQPQYGAPQGGYEPPATGYPVQPQQPQQPPLQQFSQMSIGTNQPVPTGAGQLRLNPLQPVDISMQGQPFHVTDLDQPPPPIILPANVSPSGCPFTRSHLLTSVRA